MSKVSKTKDPKRVTTLYLLKRLKESERFQDHIAERLSEIETQLESHRDKNGRVFRIHHNRLQTLEKSAEDTSKTLSMRRARVETLENGVDALRKDFKRLRRTVAGVAWFVGVAVAAGVAAWLWTNS